MMLQAAQPRAAAARRRAASRTERSAEAAPLRSPLARAAPRRRSLVVTAALAGEEHFKVLVVGGGSAGITTAAHYARKLPPNQTAVIEPSPKHFYQPLWTLVGGGFKDVKDSVRPTASVIPPGAAWLQTSVTGFQPDANRLTTADGRIIHYDYLVVATGMQAKWDRVKGLPAALGDGRVVSNMSARTAPMTWDAVSKLKSGRALFTMPKGVIKCPGAGQKVCYISEDAFRRAGTRGDIDVTLCLAADRVFGIPRYAETIQRVVRERGIDVQLRRNLVEVRPASQEAIFEVLEGPDCSPVGEAVLRYDLLHVTPPQGPVDVVARSPLANADGWVAVDPETLQHTQYENVFGLGDCAAVSTSKTAAAAAAEFVVVRDNLDALIDGVPRAEPARYDGYSSCPLVTKKGATMMMEFGKEKKYNGQILETFTPLGIVDQKNEDYLMWLIKTEVLPAVYWQCMLRGYVPWTDAKNNIKAWKRRAAALQSKALAASGL